MERWTAEAANAWWQSRKWQVGINYVTSDAVNDIEMWMDDTFNAPLIESELGIAASLGYNSVRVFLSFAVWYNEGERFLNNFDRFLALADKSGLSVMPILFDDCAFDFGSEPVYGPQPAPVLGVHNSRWVPSPGFAAQDDPAFADALKKYVFSVIGAHREDERILVWDLYNEPGNSKRFEKCLPLLEKAFRYAREAEPIQPLTAGIWEFNRNRAAEDFCLENSDVISMHCYSRLERLKERIAAIMAQGRPILVTEWLHRPAGSTVEDILPFFAENKIGAYQWGMIKGKTQTNLSWSTMNGGTPEPEPALWQHDILHPDGTPYRREEIEVLSRLTK